MIVEDLLWQDALSSWGLPRVSDGTLQGRACLYEYDIADVRVCGALRSVGVLFDARTGFPFSLGNEQVNTVVLVVRGVTAFECPQVGDWLESWVVETDEHGWECRLGQVHFPGRVVIRGCGASLYAGVIPGLSNAQPDLGCGDPLSIRQEWPTWQSEFVVTVEPEQANPHLIGGYVRRLLSASPDAHMSLDGGM
ncbi:MAG: hypothetical protein FWF43_09685 [Propionibacteriaceae bacterium]|nr:hypothetical protein [Propionibacteriaceae bacterium]